MMDDADADADAGDGGDSDGDGDGDEELARELAYVRDQIHELIELRDRRPLVPDERERYDALTRREKDLIASYSRRPADGDG
jgi:hypothetical protein